MKPISEACLRNQEPIAQVLAKPFATVKTVLEVGSGTGQHAVYIAAQLPHLRWTPSDLASCLPGIRAWMEEARLPNIEEPMELDVCADQWPKIAYDAIFTANTLHFVGWNKVEALLAGIASTLKPQGPLCIYGPFNKNHQFTSEGNQKLDAWLKGRDPESGIKDLNDVTTLAKQYQLHLDDTFSMPANNLLLVFRHHRADC